MNYNLSVPGALGRVPQICAVAPRHCIVDGEARTFATSSRAAWRPSGSKAEQGAGEPGVGQAPETPAGEAPAPTLEEVQATLAACQKQVEEEKKSAAEAKDRLMRTLADMQNLRDRTTRQIAETKQFAVQAVVKSFIEVADNLELAVSSVPVKELESGEGVDLERALALLHRLRDGVIMTESILLKLLEKEGVQRYDPAGQPFDPNLHNAMFKVPNSGVESGHVAMVIKKGYMLHDRAVRAADVGVAE